MHFPTTVQIKSIERDRPRPGFPEPYHFVVFSVISEGIHPLEIGIWVHRSYPDDQLIRVAHTFLAGRLTDMATAATDGAASIEEVDALWQRVKPRSA